MGIQSLLNLKENSNTLILMSGDQLNELIESITANTRRIVEEQYQPRYYTMDDLKELLSIKSDATIYNWISKGVVKPYYMVEGGKPYFDQAEIREQMNSGKIGKSIRNH